MKCRTCLEIINTDCMFSLQNKLCIGLSVRELLLLFIPEMVKHESIKDLICGDCMKVIQGFSNFMQKLINAEKHLKAVESAQQTTSKRFLSSLREPSGNSSINNDDSNKHTIWLENMYQIGGPEKTIKDKSVEFVDTILNGLQSKQYNTASKKYSASTSKRKKTKPQAETPTPFREDFYASQPPKTYSRKKRNQPPTKHVEQSLCSKTTVDVNNQEPGIPEIVEIVVKQEVIDVDVSNSANELYEMETSLSKETRRPPAILSAENTDADTSSSYITATVPSMVLADEFTKDNRVISITTSNEAVGTLLKSFFQSTNDLPWQSPSENKRILLLGKALPQCPICKISFPSHSSFKPHFCQAHPNETYPENDDEYRSDNPKRPKKAKIVYKCPVCSKPFCTSRLLSTHIRHEHKEYCSFTCEKCGRKFKKKVTYKLHLQNYERYQNCNMRKCHVCREVLSADVIKRHYETHRNLQCGLCSRKFLFEIHYKKHLQSHENDTDNPKPKYRKMESLCPICGKILSNGLREHMTKHTNNRSYMCDKCPKAFKSASTLKCHMRQVHVEGKNYQCTTCGKRTKTYVALQSHKLLKHTDTYKHVCHICDATFKRGDYYRRHLRIHTGAEQPHKNQKQTKKSIRGHSRQKKYFISSTTKSDVPLPCKYCNRKFHYIYKLRQHLLNTHLMASTNYKCAYCDMTFANQANKNRHEKRHTDPKLLGLTCVVCYCRFRTKKEMEAHAAKHKGSKKRKCDECGETFPSKYLMMNHKRYKHFGPDCIDKQRDELLVDGLSEYTV